MTLHMIHSDSTQPGLALEITYRLHYEMVYIYSAYWIYENESIRM